MLLLEVLLVPLLAFRAHFAVEAQRLVAVAYDLPLVPDGTEFALDGFEETEGLVVFQIVFLGQDRLKLAADGLIWAGNILEQAFSDVQKVLRVGHVGFGAAVPLFVSFCVDALEPELLQHAQNHLPRENVGAVQAGYLDVIRVAALFVKQLGA